jgi:hypothetical protein
MTIEVYFIIMLIALLFLCYFIAIKAYEKGFESGLKIGKVIGKSDATSEVETEFHCGIEESGGHAYNCNDCPNKCEEYYQWDKEMNKYGNDD